MDTRIPVTIITGFLGAGKTTLLNNLIKKYTNKKFAVIENEFGEIGIDGGLIVGAKDNIFELSNGCICCSLNDDFYETIGKLLSSDHVFNHLLIETTGIADPDSIVNAFLSSEDIQLQFRIDSVICLADTVNIEDLIKEQPEVRKQLALSDMVLLNKMDSISEEYGKTVQNLVLKCAPLSKIIPVAQANISQIDILDTFSFSGKAVEKATLSFQNLTVSNRYSGTSASVLQKNSNLQHDITSEGLIIPGSFDKGKFIFWMQNYLYYNRNTIFRVKGIVSFSDINERLIFQAVRDSFMFENSESWGTESRFSKLVFIGKNIDRDKLEDNLYQLLSTNSAFSENMSE